MEKKVTSKVTILSMHLEALEMLKLDWVQEKIKLRDEEGRIHGFVEFKI